ncbi:MAG: hypothetical protein JSU57_02955 [Candidatus Heimdallarchaeota archaeon]|nr:MAG: hypothetical protein JSU57_02955 [Candidatus Heimdallarchaeota archaeon]
MTHVASLVIENPFHNFTARSDIPELFNLNRPNKEALNLVIRFLEIVRRKKRESVILPIIAEAGYGKTHFYWVLRETITEAYVVYIPVPTNPNRVYSHFYFETVKAGGAPLLEYVADALTQKYRKVEHAAADFPGMGNIVINGFFALKDPKQSRLALKWLTGFDIDDETAHFKRTIMDDEELAFAALKVILKVIDKPIIFFIDELESLFIALGPEAELQFLETLKKMHNEASNFILCLACLTTLWDTILDLSSTAVQSRIEPPVVLKRFSKKDIQAYCLQMLQDFHSKFEIILQDGNSLWPLNKADIESAYAYSHGNPREAIKWLAGCIEDRKTPLLKDLEKNQKHLSRFSKQIKKIIDKMNQFSVGVLQRKNGAFISLTAPEKRVLVTVPPIQDMEKVFHQSYWKSLKEVITDEDYNETILIGSTPEKEAEEDYQVKIFSELELKTDFQEYLKEI